MQLYDKVIIMLVVYFFFIGYLLIKNTELGLPSVFILSFILSICVESLFRILADSGALSYKQ